MKTGLLFVVLGCGVVFGQDLGDLTPQMPVSDPTCPYFGKDAQGSWSQIAGSPAASPNARRLSSLTSKVMANLAALPGGGRTGTAIDLSNAGLIDQYIYSALESADVQPAGP